jgi:hypothetical protein
MFSVTLFLLRQTLCRLAPPCPFHLPFPSFSDVAEARSCFACIVVMSLGGHRGDLDAVSRRKISAPAGNRTYVM